MEELFKRIEQDVYRMGNEGAIHLAPILNDMVLHSYPLILQDFILDQTGKTLDIDEFTEITGFSGDMMKYIIENHLAVNVFIQGENLIIKATAFSIEDDMFYIEYNHAGDKKALQITLSGDTFQILVKDIDSGGGNYLTKDDIINSLDSLDAQKVLAASQGYVLNESIFPYFDINGSNWHGLLLEDINNTTPIEEINEVYASKFEEMGKLMLREHILVICASQNGNYSVMMASYSSENYQGNTRYHLDFNSLRGDSIAINLIVSENMDEVIQVLNT
nr:MAG: hypothetical protein [Bacteriophage sp.]